MNILPFAQPCARTSRHRNSARVEVKHTPAVGESGVDWFRLPKIRVLKACIRSASIAGDVCAAARFKADLRKAEAQQKAFATGARS